MVGGIIALCLTGCGLLLIIIGLTLSVLDWRRKTGGTIKATGLSTISELTKLATALRDYPLGMQLIFLGVLLMLSGGVTGGVADVTG